MNAQTQFMLDQMCAGFAGVAAAITYSEVAPKCERDSWVPKVAACAAGAAVMGGLMWAHRAIADL